MYIIRCIGLLVLSLLFSCSGRIEVDQAIDGLPDIFPDYIGVTIPPNIAPLNFMLKGESDGARAIIKYGDREIEVDCHDSSFDIPESSWHEMIELAKGDSVAITMLERRGDRWFSYSPFHIYVANEPVDSWLAYRLIEPGYELWNRMGIYQRNLASFDECAIIENRMSGNNCMNCHSFCNRDPKRMLFHMRETNSCTILLDGEHVEKLNTKTERTISPLVYPSWHPSGRFVAFSVNKTSQSFHMNHPNRVEVFDSASEVVVYDVERHEIVTSPLLFSKDRFETFPTFSPDGKRLYFCSAEAKKMPKEYDEVRYDLCSISYDPESRSFGSQVDTLLKASEIGKSVSFPRVSPDGKYLLCTLSGYGNFSIWHKDADLYMIDLSTKSCLPLDGVNSEDVESYHSWSGNSRWIVFSSRRLDGLYTRPYLAYIDEDGVASKPFILPQEDPGFYSAFMKSYNIPEFIEDRVESSGWELSRKAIEDRGIDISFK